MARRPAARVPSCLELSWGGTPRKDTFMFGRITTEPIEQVEPNVDLQTAVTALIKIAENVEISAGSNCRRQSCCSYSYWGTQNLEPSMSSTESTGFGTPSTSKTSNSVGIA
jgi:hypothetical protein